ncbi:hypothetical protein GW943_03040 [Candidatus Parcubacteria bacterium]|uniref:Uncharacterized protein n=1 Tax=Candidatus Kaiserbacteria bacterium CG10_big_fil_rev_8_21_14_0_10_47_16 TaxID=1974608 RepID=A0A2H0UE10_9BACT|nr:hypothetical protein [Candidatus Parcubacteria bacterium]PIR84649.1 MAG: hypothetical protein COU16_03710 [Candidatus Kaiserbacteria bacterium CG10_big_fil_rev_8_21_14_0_10_47_16]
MTNLIPPIAEAVIRKEYRLRVFSVWALLLAVVAILSGILLVPTYVLVESQQKALSLQSSSTQVETAKALEADVQITNTLVKKLAIDESEIQFADLITRITETGGTKIELRGFQIVRSTDTKQGMTMQVRGLAVSREALKDFQSRLEAFPEITAVAIPLSDLVRSTDVSFTAMVTFSTDSK